MKDETLAKQEDFGTDGQYTAADMASQGAQGWRDGYAWGKSEMRPKGCEMGLVETLEKGFPLLSDEGLDEVEHHCEWAVQQDRKRLHTILAAFKNVETSRN